MTMYSKRVKKQDNDTHDFIDLASSVTDSLASDIRYVCKEYTEPQQILQDYPQAKLYNPHSGRCYICPNCSGIYNSSLEKLAKASKRLQSSLGKESDNAPFIMTIPEDKGLIEPEDEYAKYDPEGDNDHRMEMQGFHIIESRIELTDSQGRNRTFVKRTNASTPTKTDNNDAS